MIFYFDFRSKHNRFFSHFFFCFYQNSVFVDDYMATGLAWHFSTFVVQKMQFTFFNNNKSSLFSYRFMWTYLYYVDKIASNFQALDSHARATKADDCFFIISFLFHVLQTTRFFHRMCYALCTLHFVLSVSKVLFITFNPMNKWLKNQKPCNVQSMQKRQRSFECFHSIFDSISF